VFHVILTAEMFAVVHFSREDRTEQALSTHPAVPTADNCTHPSRRIPVNVWQ